ncbi:MAG: hypothetical protein J4A00_03030 [Gammaproteobacteria bacterium]|nr:hypothetical protein [Gammaproteobacteria bacterium]
MMDRNPMFGERDGVIWRILFVVLAVFLVFSVYSSWQQFGGGLLGHMWNAMFADPLVHFAIWDLAALMALVSFWVYRDCQRRQIGVWYLWVLAFYAFGTLGVLAYLMYAARKPVLTDPTSA